MSETSKAADDLRQLIDHSKRIVFFGGAGMSTESGLPDFRSAHGLYNRAEGRSYEEMLSIGFFHSHPEEFWQFYRDVMLYPDAKPNAGHYALARLEKQGKLKAVVTQNIDGLHQDAGSQTVYELHGTVLRNLCMKCGKVYDLDYILKQEGPPRCVCGGMLRPDIVFYGEQLDSTVVDSAIRAISHCDLLIVGGTSLTVYPAAGLLNYRHGAKLALINKQETAYDHQADLVIHESIAAVLDGAIAKGE
ncbi:MAG TPA: NAD-dependent protein deacylase [Candidatus Limiplasma sp.]|nr:NAD-dependent protein deacylase [Candidatus Limiplasma sp.]